MMMDFIKRTISTRIALALVLATAAHGDYAQSTDGPAIEEQAAPSSEQFAPAGTDSILPADTDSMQPGLAQEPAAIGTVTKIPTAVRGVPGDFWADIELGQRDFTEINERLIVPFKLKQPAGVAIDRSVAPGRMYVWDSGNNRILGFDLATCYNRAPPCNAALVIGQPSATDYGACNHDSGFASYPFRVPSSATSLCGVGEYTFTVLEDKTWAGLYVDPHGNLWVPDVRNHRVLKFNSPFTTDTIADDVWGQADFSGNLCNRVTNFFGPGGPAPTPSQPTASTLCLGDFTSGVTLDAAGNLWVADAGNNRVLRFPNHNGTLAKTADIVLGQPSFTSSAAGRLLNQLSGPSQVRFDPAGNLLVVDAFENRVSPRVLKFSPPFSTGMSGRVFVECREWNAAHNECVRAPFGLEIDPFRNGVWVTYSEPNLTRPLLFNYDGTLRRGLEELGTGALGNPTIGSFALDTNHDLLFSTYVYGQDVVRVTQDPNGQFRIKSRLFTPPDGPNLSARGRIEQSSTARGAGLPSRAISSSSPTAACCSGTIAPRCTAVRIPTVTSAAIRSPTCRATTPAKPRSAR
jgi:hypothetical protein